MGIKSIMKKNKQIQMNTLTKIEPEHEQFIKMYATPYEVNGEVYYFFPVTFKEEKEHPGFYELLKSEKTKEPK